MHPCTFLQVVRMGPKLVDATIELHRSVMNHFLPTSGQQRAGQCSRHAGNQRAAAARTNCPCSSRTAHPSSTSVAVKFHYQFNMRELGNVAQGLCRMTKEAYKEPLQARAGVADDTGCCAIRLPIDL